MCRTYNAIGSLTTLKLLLEENNIRDFKSLKEVMNFQSAYPTIRQKIVADHEKLIENEREVLHVELKQLDTTIEIQKQEAEQKLINEIDCLKKQLKSLADDQSTTLYQKLKMPIVQFVSKRKISHKERDFEIRVKESIIDLIEEQHIKKKRYEFISTQFEKAVEQSAGTDLLDIEKKKTLIDKSNNYIYGALGEQKVVKTLEALSDDYFLINDFDITFSTAFYNRQQNDYIKSIQIDHLLVAPSGIFLIETKNWSEKSLKDLSLRSPVQQIRRTSFALFKLLNNEIADYHFRLANHHWGERKISIKNLVVLTNIKPKEEFQYVKVLTLNELINYVNYFKPIFSSAETKCIADFLLKINAKKGIQKPY